MKVRKLLFSFLLATTLVATSTAHVDAANPGPLSPSITVTAAVGTNPGTVYTSGQTKRIVDVAWNAGSDYPYCEIYYTVNSANQTELGRGHDGAKPLTVTAGSTYALWMIVYLGAQGQDVRKVAQFTVVGDQGNPPSPIPAPSGGGGLSKVGIGDTIGTRNPATRYALAINNVRVSSGPHHIMVRFNGPPNQVPYVAIGRAAPIMKNGEWVFDTNLVGGGFVGPATVSDAEKARGEYTFASAAGTSISSDGLEPGTTYYYIISIPAGAGRRPFQNTDKFTMQGEATTVRVVWEQVRIVDDSDDLSTGEIRMWFWTNYGQPSAKAPNEYGNGDADSGHTYDIHRSVVIENAPNLLSFSASGEENDGAFTDNTTNPAPIKGPYDTGGIYSSEGNVANGTFDLSQYADNTKVPFNLSSMPNGGSKGDLRFVVSGYFVITRAPVSRNSGTSENTGTNSSALIPTPATPAPVKAIGRVKQSPSTTATPRSICDVAREARQRNSPAAPGLEAQCRASKKP